MSQRQSVTIHVYSGEQYDAGWPFNSSTKLVEVIAWFQGKLDEVPAEHRLDATCRISATSSHDSWYATIEISYTRPETDEEVRSRCILEQRSAASMQRLEIEALRRLRAKYPDAT